MHDFVNEDPFEGKANENSEKVPIDLEGIID